MDPDHLPPSKPRKVRFAPKAPPRRTPKPADPKTEIEEEDDTPGDDEAAHSLRRLVNDRLGRRGPKIEKKSSVQVVFAHGSASSASIRSYGVPREGNSSKSNGSGSRNSAAADEQVLSSLPSTGEPYGISGGSENALDASSQKKERDYREPWDYHHTDYPITLPFRRPYSGDPERLDEAEFGDAADNLEYNENTIDPALELGLLEETDKPRMLFFQFPPNLPLTKRSVSAKGKEIAGKFTSTCDTVASASVKGIERAGKSILLSDAGASTASEGKQTMGSSGMPSGKGNDSKMRCHLEDLPGGYMGKMLVYKSGAIKWKLGDVMYDVSPGVSCVAAQEVMAINTVDKNCCALGELSKRAVVTPDIDSLLDNVIDLD